MSALPAPTVAPQPAPRVTLPGAGVSDAPLWAAARQLEAMAIGQMLQPMFATVDPSANPFSGGSAEAAWRPMLVDAMAKQMADAGGIGLASAVHAVLLRQQEHHQDKLSGTKA
jgi:flagellar protein FlgJ